MLEGYRPGVKRHARLRIVFFPILCISDDRMPDAGQVNPYLILPAGQEDQFQQRISFRHPKYDIGGLGQLPLIIVRCCIDVIPFILRQGSSNRSRTFFTLAMNNGQVLLFSLLPSVLQTEFRLFALSKDKRSGCIPVQSVNDVKVFPASAAPLADVLRQNRVCGKLVFSLSVATARRPAGLSTTRMSLSSYRTAVLSAKTLHSSLMVSA